MKLLDKNLQASLFENGIEVDKDLPKFNKIKNIKEENENKDSSEVNINNNIVLPIGTNFSNQEKEVLDKLISLGELRKLDKYTKDNNANKFNVEVCLPILQRELKRHQIIFDSSNFFNGRNELDEINNNQDSNNSNENKSKKLKLFSFFKNFLKKDNDTKIEKDPEFIEIDILELFDKVKILSSKEVEFVNRIDSYLNLLRKARKLNQISHLEDLTEKLIEHIYSAILSTTEFNHFIYIEDLVKLQLRCKKQLDLDYIRNFNRIIPDEVAEKKIKADELEIFDNYVILHYDPEGKNYKETAKEKAARKDPVLFGVIKGSNKLYYIGSWVDEYCDLTWDKVVELLGEDKKE